MFILAPHRLILTIINLKLSYHFLGVISHVTVNSRQITFSQRSINSDKQWLSKQYFHRLMHDKLIAMALRFFINTIVIWVQYFQATSFSFLITTQSTAFYLLSYFILFEDSDLFLNNKYIYIFIKKKFSWLEQLYVSF